MSTNSPEQQQGRVTLMVDGTPVQSGFRVVTTELLAGGPIELEFFVETQSSVPLRFSVSGDRVRQRPAQFEFSATFEGLPLDDPIGSAPDLGGPATIAEVMTNSPWQQPLVLNQFIRLERTRDRLALGATGRLELTCHRAIALSLTDTAALLNQGAQVVTVPLRIDLRRDDTALNTWITQAFDEVMQGPPSLREHPLALLLALRSVARPQIEALTHHPDAAVVSRARQALEIAQ
jgi:hypothetical protein